MRGGRSARAGQTRRRVRKRGRRFAEAGGGRDVACGLVGGVKLTWRGSDGGGGVGGRIGSAVVKFELVVEVWEGVGIGAPVGAWEGWEDDALLESEGEEGEVEVNGQGAIVTMLFESCGMVRLSYVGGGVVRYYRWDELKEPERGLMFMMTSSGLGKLFRSFHSFRAFWLAIYQFRGPV